MFIPTHQIIKVPPQNVFQSPHDYLREKGSFHLPNGYNNIALINPIQEKKFGKSTTSFLLASEVYNTVKINEL